MKTFISGNTVFDEHLGRVGYSKIGLTVNSTHYLGRDEWKRAAAS